MLTTKCNLLALDSLDLAVPVVAGALQRLSVPSPSRTPVTVAAPARPNTARLPAAYGKLPP